MYSKFQKMILSLLLVLLLALTACGENGSGGAAQTPVASAEGEGQKAGSSAENGKATESGETAGSAASVGSEPAAASSSASEEVPEKGNEAMTLGDLAGSGFSLQIEENTFSEKTEIRAEVADAESAGIVAPEKYEIIGSPIVLESGEDGTDVFATDVVLKVPMLEGDTELDRYVFCYLDEETGAVRYFLPTGYDLADGTMEIALPHFSLWAPAKLTKEEQIESFLDQYCMQQAVEQDQKKQAASELEPYIRAKAEALGLTEQATKDLIQSTVNYLGGAFKGDEDNPTKYGDTIETGTKAVTAVMRGVIDGDPEAAASGLEDAVNGALMHAWDELKFNERIDKVLNSEVAGGTTGKILSSSGGLARMAGYLAEGDIKGGMEELGGVLQGIHPAAEFATKGTVFLASLGNQAFTNWKSNQVEELYKIYKNGAEDVWGNEVLPADRESFLTYLNTSSGFTMAKGVNRFYKMDKIEETCKKYGWDFKTYSEMPEKYRNIFDQRAEDGLMAYFETRLKQEKVAEELKQYERKNIETMLSSYGALTAGNYNKFFGEQDSEDYDLTARLQRMVYVRGLISQYVDEEKLLESVKADSFNYGDIMNWWIGYVNDHPRDEALNLFLADLKEYDLLNSKFAPAGKLEDLVGSYSGTISLTGITLSDTAYEQFVTNQAEMMEEGEEVPTKAQCDEELNAMIAEGALAASNEMTISSDDPASGGCVISLTLVNDDGENTPVSVPAAYSNGVFKLSDPGSGTLKVSTDSAAPGIKGSGLKIGIGEGEGVLYTLSLNVDVTKD